MKSAAEYAVYKGDSFICSGTSYECAKAMKIKLESFKYLLTPAYQRKIDQRKVANNYKNVIKLDEDEE
jgi:hypothetical protein